MTLVLLPTQPAHSAALHLVQNEKSRAEFQRRIVQFFSEKKCDQVQKMATPDTFEWLRPNVLAVVAFCEPQGIDSENLFKIAGEKDPAGDLIQVLHAKYVWKRNPEAAKPLWESVLKHARNTYLKTMAKEYLSGNVDKDEELNLNQITFEGRLRTAVAFEKNPKLPYAAKPIVDRPQGESNFRFAGSAQRWTSFGSTSANYTGAYREYFKNSELNMFDNQLELPMSLRLGTYEDIVIRPFTAISLAGNKTFSTQMGFGVMGLAYRPNYKQSVQASIFKERLLFPSLNAQEGMHFRFDYSWELFPTSWIFQYLLLMEHVTAIHDFENGTDIKYSHTDVGGQFNAQYLLRGITLEMNVRGVFRVDSQASEFAAKDSGKIIRERRNDFNLGIRTAATIPMFSYVQIQPWYEFSQNFSTLSGNDFANYNIVNHIVGLALISEFSNY